MNATPTILLALAAIAVPTAARGDPTARGAPADDGYCDFVEGVAASASATRLSPELIGQFGQIEQPSFAVNPGSSTLRLITGVQYRLTGIYEGLAIRDHGKADCRRHRALAQVRGQTEARALAAKLAVLDQAEHDASAMLARDRAGVAARRTTTQQAIATELRVEELRALTADTKRALAALPPVSSAPLGTALARYQAADAQMERDEAKLRRAQAFDVSVRAGVDDALDGTATGAGYFAVVQLGINLGALWQGSAEHRAAAGRRRQLAAGHDPLVADATVDRLRALAEVDAVRARQTAALVADLDKQMRALARVGGDDNRRYRETLWFDWVKAKAEHAYAAALVTSLHEAIGGGAAP